MTELFTGPQEKALMALAGGAKVFKAAYEAGVARETVSRWLSDERFAAELARRREQVWQQYRDRLTQLVDLALISLEELLRPPHQLVREDDYDPRVRLDAIALVLRCSGLAPAGGNVPGVVVNVGASASASATVETAAKPTNIIDAEYRRPSDGR